MSNLLVSAMPAAAVAAGSLAVWAAVRHRQMHRWLPEYLFPARWQPPVTLDRAPVDVFIAVCDHFEPEVGRPGRRTACERVDRWHEAYPRLFSRFRDSRGRPPQHTFFFPADEYAAEYVDPLADLCARGFGDVDIHLHHDHDTAEGLREKLETFKGTLADQHGLLRRDPQTGEVVYGFIHGNWALCNSRPDGRWCGVAEEIPILLETGCYADFTMPSAPSDTQTRTINSIYYACDRPGRTKSHDRGIPARVGAAPPANSLLMIQGPLGLNWRDRKWGILPRIENGDLHAPNPPTWPRMLDWLKAGVRVQGQPNWVFVKLHTHGCKPGNIDLWLGDRVQQFHAELAGQAAANPLFRYHYVTAWEMAQLVHSAEQKSVSQEPGRAAPVACAVLT